MTYTNKLLTYLGFCPTKESAQHFNIDLNQLIERTQNWNPIKLLSIIGVLLLLIGLLPYYYEDTSITGVTDAITLRCWLGLASFVLGAILIIFGAIVARASDGSRTILDAGD